METIEQKRAAIAQHLQNAVESINAAQDIANGNLPYILTTDQWNQLAGARRVIAELLP